MRRHHLPLSLLALACSSDPTATASVPSDPPPVSVSAGTGPSSHVRPLIGSENSKSPTPVSNGASGATYPGATTPFGMVQWSPDVQGASPPGYRYETSTLYGFPLTHLNGAGCSGLHDFPVMVGTAPPDPSSPDHDTFSHDAELAHAGFYEVTLGSGVRVDLTATARTGFARFTFPDGPQGFVWMRSALAADKIATRAFSAHFVEKELIQGSRTSTFFCASPADSTMYFAARFDRAPIERGTFLDGDAGDPESVSGIDSLYWLEFDTSKRHVVQMKVGLSHVSEAAALANLDAESPGFDFDAVHTAALATWDARLGAVEVTGGSDDDSASFYTALYHVLVQPGIASDVDGAWVGFDGATKQVAPRARYENYSGWDVYRSWVHLAAVVAPTEVSDLAQSLVDAGSQCGALPRWSLGSDDTGSMVGDPSDGLLAGAHAFGARDFDTATALALMKKGATDPAAKCNRYAARPGLADYQSLGYIASETKVWGPPSTTMEYAVADAALGRFAQVTGHAITAATFLARSGNWRKVFDPSVGYVQARHHDNAAGAASFVATAPDDDTYFVEGNPAQYTFMVPQDVPGLIAALGGDAAFIARLDTLFTELNAGVTRPYFYMGNEPQFATPWLYVYAGAPHKTAAVVRRIQQELFTPQPSGLPGNEDLGATSAWLVWSMLGLYPVQPGTGVLVVGSPVFPEATVHLAGGKSLVIHAQGAAPDAPYVQSLSLNGAPLTRAWLRWDELKDGATLDFVLGAAPNAAFGAAQGDRPPPK